MMTERNLYKNLRGNKVIFEEINNTLGIKFSYQWTTCDTYGFVKTSSLKNLNKENISTSIALRWFSKHFALGS